MIFEVKKISNGWSIKGAWTEPGGAGIQPEPRMEELYCREIGEIASVMAVWAKEGFEAAHKNLLEMLRLKEAAKCQKDN